MADQLLAEHWHRVTAVSEVLVDRLHLTGSEVADLAVTPNGTHAAGCTN